MEKNSRARSFCGLIDCEPADSDIASSYIEPHAPARNPDHWNDLSGHPAINCPHANFVARSKVSFIAEGGSHKFDMT
jgi:hypothetical protein